MPRRRRHGPMLPFATDRLRIRDFTAEDEQGVLALYGERRITRHMAHGPRTARSARQHLARVMREQREQPRVRWDMAVEPAGGGPLVGACDLALLAPDEAEIGYLLAPASWGKGFGTEIATALLDLAFRELSVERVQSTVEVHNRRSLRVLDKAGLRWEATLRRHLRVGPRWWDVHVYAIVRDEWLQARRRTSPTGDCHIVAEKS